MTVINMHLFSKALNMYTTVNVLLPKMEKDMPVLYLLHGLADDADSWLNKTNITRYACEAGVAVVMPDGGLSCYEDMAHGEKYREYIACELPRMMQRAFPISHAREKNFIAGCSMGGFGALKIALTYPEAFGYCASLSGAVDLVGRGVPADIEEWRGNFGFDFEDCSYLAGGASDIFDLTKKLAASGKEMPAIYLWCGESDFLLDMNRRYNALLSELGVDYIYEESEGNHSWKWWDLHIQDALAYLLGK